MPIIIQCLRISTNKVDQLIFNGIKQNSQENQLGCVRKNKQTCNNLI